MDPPGPSRVKGFASESENPDSQRHSDITPQYLTVGDGESTYATQLRSMLDHDSGYGGSMADDETLSRGWMSNSASSFQASDRLGEHGPGEQERRAINGHILQMQYNQNRNVLARAITQTMELLRRLQEMNSQWPAHYPSIKRAPSPGPSPPRKDVRPGLHQTQTSYGSPRPEAVQQSSRVRPSGLQRASTSLGELQSNHEGGQTRVRSNSGEPRLVTPQLAQQFSVLKIELKMEGASQTELVHSLEKQSIASLLDGQINNSIRHLHSLRDRIEDTSSKVLVTGDLNAGKSTFCNALLRRKILPEDQQPCTAIFCEVLDVRENSGLEEVHAIPIGATYNRHDESTYHVYALRQLEDIVVDNEHYSQCKVYVKDVRSVDQSLLNNGVVDIALIDAPGLNNDSLKTTAVFARQEEIDVVVFVVSAANHFTLSAKEFIFNAAREKAYIFMVVNGFDNIRDKKRCQDGILKQVAQLSPATFKEADELVHFVSSNAVPVAPAGYSDRNPGDDNGGGGSSGTFQFIEDDAIPGANKNDDNANRKGNDKNDEPKKDKKPTSPKSDSNGKGKGKEEEQEKIEDFNELETSLRRFVLEKRARSKLAPARTYLLNVLGDLLSLASVNRDVATSELDRIDRELCNIEPALDKSKKSKSEAGDRADVIIEETTSEIYNHTRSILSSTISQIGNTDMGVYYPGLFSIYDYSESLKTAMLNTISNTVSKCEEHARSRTSSGVNMIKSLGILHLGDSYQDLTFKSDKLFKSRKDVLGRQIDLHVDIWDVFNLSNLSFWEKQEKVAGTGMAVTVAGIVGGRMFGGTAWLDSAMGVAKVVGPNNLRKLIIPSIVLAATLTISYLLSTLPKSLPRTLASKLSLALKEMDYTHANSTRISSEVRRALTYPAAQLREGLARDVTKLNEQRDEKIKVKKESEVAKKYFVNLVREADGARRGVEGVDLEAAIPGM